MRRLNIAAALGATLPFLTGCVWATAGYETFEIRPEPAAFAAPAVVERALPLSRTEIAYARDTARVVFRRRQAERTPGFVREGADGYALCLRSGRDYALLVFSQRVFEEAISQAADDARVLRGAAETAVCRERGQRWVAV